MKLEISKKIVKAHWDDANIVLLGTMTDAELAKRLGMKHAAVLYKRLALGVPSFKNRKEHEWKQKDLRLLGKKSDQQLADMLGLAKTTVINKRRSLGIEAFAYKSKLWRTWTENELALLGKHTDKEIARRLKMQEANVTSKRQVLGIAPFRPRMENKRPRPDAVKWTRHTLALLGKQPDMQVCGIIGISRKSVMRKRKELGIPSYAVGTQYWHPWTEEEVKRLGQTTDRELAEQLGIQPMCVTAKRRHLGIESFTKASGAKIEYRWEQKEVARLGTIPDKTLAQELGLGVGIVRKKRLQVGIAANHGAKRSPDKWTPEILARLGKEPLQQIATEIGVTREAVRQKCLKLGITTRYRKR